MIDLIATKIFKGNKNLAFIAITVLSMTILIIIIALFVNGCDKNVNGYSDLENKLVSAAKKYYSDNQDNLFNNGNDQVIISDSELVTGNYIKELNKIFTNDSCSGNVNIIKSNDSYLYVPYLKCQNYETKKLVSEITSNVVNEGNGLYFLNDEYVFRGEYVNNYVSFSGKTWRIIGIDSTGIRMYLVEKKLGKTTWDDRYNMDKGSSVGKNSFETSRISEFLKDSYENNTFITNDNRQFLVNANWCIGGSLEKTKISNVNLCGKKAKSYIGAFYITDFAKASLEPQCKNFDDIQCINYNYLSELNSSTWTLNYYLDNSYQVYYLNDSGVNATGASRSISLIPVVYLNSNIKYVSGNGTISNPYVVK